MTLVVIATSLWWSGAATPHIRWEINDLFVNADLDENGFLSTDMHIAVENEGLVPFTLTGISVEIPGFRLMPVDEAYDETTSVTVGSGDTEILRRQLAITDCAAVPHEPQPIRFTYRTWMYSETEEVTWGSWHLTAASGEQVPVAWQRGLAGKVCSEAVSSEWF
ncbi:hypothetical protein ACTMTF_44000 [Nonomuraea sp. ZG12]|uniref:hypothetical protein n=1 Tax=Nonomuraea sp. ZG12 TaxID=3452207 RepID=UPI003F8BAB8E